MSTVTVTAGSRAHTYPLDIAGYGDFIASGGQVQGLQPFVTATLVLIKATGWVRGAQGWVVMDDSGLAYHVAVDERGHHRVLACAPMSGPLRSHYVA